MIDSPHQEIKGRERQGDGKGDEDECIYTASEGCLDEERLEDDKEVIDLQ